MIYNRIVKLCSENGISIHFLEKTLGLGNGTIKGWTTNTPKLTLLKKVCDYFGITLDDMVREDA